MMVSVKKAVFLITGVIFTGMLHAQQSKLADPALFSNVFVDNKNNLFFKKADNSIQYMKNNTPKYSLNNFQNCFTGTDKGLEFDIRDTNFNGILYFGFYSKEKYPQIKYLPCKYEIIKGKSFVNLKDSSLTGVIDRSASMKSGYRITDRGGNNVYDGKINIIAERGFTVDYTVINGPYINCLTYNTATISFETNKKIIASVAVNNKTYKDEKENCHHEFEIKDLKPDTAYSYKILYGTGADTYSFKTAIMKGSDKPFVFAFVCDSRANNAFINRNIYGVNASMVKKIMNSATDKNAAFIQFSG
ncbi:MAG: fibronectin type III domain-containing protein, partial [Bacteroidales bacterium]|nr:fibronectin type III domain-containing protein [Bacteroidales bacterium]